MWTCDFSADGRVAALPLKDDGTLVVHRGEHRRTLRLGPQYDVRGVIVSPDGRWVVSGSHWDDGAGIKYKVWDTDSGKLLANLPYPKGKGGLGFSADSDWLYVADQGGRWLYMPALAAPTGAPKPKSPEIPPSDAIYPGDILSPDHRLRALGTDGGVIRIVSPETGQEVARLPTPEVGTVTPDTFSPDGSRLLARGAESGDLYVFDLCRIREQLTELSLDWAESQPALPARAKEESPALAPRLEVKLVDAEWATSPARMDQYERQLVALQLFVNPLDPDAHYHLGKLLIGSNQFADAQVHLGTALALCPDLVGVYLLCAEAAVQLSHWDDAVADAGHYLEKFPYDILAHLLRAVANHGRHRDAEAVADVTALIATYPEVPSLYKRCATYYEALGKADLAAADRAKASKLGPEDPEDLNAEAWRLVTGPKESHNPVKAIALIRRAIELRPDEAMYRNTLGVAQYRKGDYLPAIESLEKSLALGKGQSDAFDLDFLAMCHKKLGHAAEAKDCFDRAAVWTRQHQNQFPAGIFDELAGFQTEAESVLKEP